MLKPWSELYSIFGISFLFTHPEYLQFKGKCFTSAESTQLSLTTNEKDQFQFLPTRQKPKTDLQYMALCLKEQLHRVTSALGQYPPDSDNLSKSIQHV